MLSDTIFLTEMEEDMKSMWKKSVMALLAAALLVGMLPLSGQEVKAEKAENSVSENTTQQLKVYPASETVKLYVGMKYAPIIKWESEQKIGTVADLKNSVFKSANKKIATIDKKGIVTAKKAGNTKIKVKSDEWSGTISIKVLPIKKVNTKKLVKTIKVSKSCPKFELVATYDKNATEVKKGYVKANKEYLMQLVSVSIYKQPDNSKRYVLNYAVCNKKGKRIKNVKYEQIPYEQYLVCYGVCNDLDFSMECIKYLCEEKEFQMHYEYPIIEKEQLHKSTKKSIDDLTLEYGWRNTCL